MKIHSFPPLFAVALFLAVPQPAHSLVAFPGNDDDPYGGTVEKPGGCGPADFNIRDHGYEDQYRGWYDPLQCGICNQYCRWVGNGYSGGDPAHKVVDSSGSYWSCQTNDDVWPKYKDVARDNGNDPETFPFKKCDVKNDHDPYVYSQVDGPNINIQVVQDIKAVPPRDGVGHERFTVTADSIYAEPNQYKITKVFITLTVESVQRYPFIYLEHSGRSVALCRSSNFVPTCVGGTTTYSDDGVGPWGSSAVEPNAPLSRLIGYDPTGSWDISFIDLHILGWTLWIEAMDDSGNRRILRGGGTGNQK